jgi:cytochrome b561
VNRAASYTRTAIILHWVIALSIFGLLAVGLYMEDLKASPEKIRLYLMHKSFGLTVLALVIVRIVWRLTHRPPELPPATPSWQRAAASISHFALYFLMLLMPVSGWLMNSASGFPLKWFGMVPIPALMGTDSEARELWESVHAVSAWLLMALIAVHIAAALKHHFINRDQVLRRMLSKPR